MENQDFKVIETQEQLDEVIKNRLDRQEKQLTKQYEKYTSPEDLESLKQSHKKELQDLNEAHSKELAKFKDVEEQLKAKDAEIHKYAVGAVKNSVAHELDLPFEAIEFLQGEDEKEIRESAEKLKSMTGKSHFVAPTKDRESAHEDNLTAAYKRALEELKSQ